MNEESKIGYREVLALLVFMMASKIFLSFPRDLVYQGKTGGWLVVLLSGLFSLIGFCFIYLLLKKYPDKNLIEISSYLTGPVLGLIIGLLIFSFFLVNTALLLRKFSETFILAILPRTPISVIMLFFLILLIYSVLKGIETITRVAWFYGPYLLGTLVTILRFSVIHAHLYNLSPLLGPGPLVIVKYSLVDLSLFSEVIFLALVAPLIREKTKIFKVGLMSIVITSCINLIVVLIIIMVFTAEAVERLSLPLFQLARLITFGAFIQRVESVFVFLYFLAASIQLGGLFYGTVSSYAQTFKITNYRPLVFPLAVLIFVISLLPPSMTDSIIINDFIFSRFYGIIAFGVPFLLWLVSLIIKKRGKIIHG